MSSESVAEVVMELAEPIADMMGLTVVDVDYREARGKGLLRVYVDRRGRGGTAAGGVTMEECEEFSRHLSDELDARDPIAGSYLLEVSSPGLDRELTKERDFLIFSGRKVFLRTRRQEEFRGFLLGLEEGRVVLDRPEGIICLPLEEVALARLDEVEGR